MFFRCFKLPNKLRIGVTTPRQTVPYLTAAPPDVLCNRAQGRSLLINLEVWDSHVRESKRPFHRIVFFASSECRIFYFHPTDRPTAEIRTWEFYSFIWCSTLFWRTGRSTGGVYDNQVDKSKQHHRERNLNG